MQIAMVHSFYSSAQPSGENSVVLSEVDALRRAGHDVAIFAARTDDQEGSRLFHLRAGLRVASGMGRNPLAAIQDYSPDVVHIHNLFPNFSRRWVTDIRAPVVHTVHNYRPVCIAGTLYREGEKCTLCLQGNLWPGIRHACYRDSVMASVAASVGRRRQVGDDPVFARADAIIMLTELQREVYRSAGYWSHKTHIDPNFLPAELEHRPLATGLRTKAFVFVGRLSAEKGILELIKRWPLDVPLRIIGDGPLRQAIAEAGHPTARLLGSLPRDEVMQELRNSVGLVFPSRWLETFGLVYLEALAAGIPTLAFEGNTVARMVDGDRTGLVVGWDDDLAQQVAAFTRQRRALTKRCRVTFEDRYSESAFLIRRVALYESLLSPPSRGV